MHIYEACPEVENESVLLYIPHINDRLAHWRGIEFPVIANPTFGSLRASAHTGVAISIFRRTRTR